MKKKNNKKKIKIQRLEGIQAQIYQMDEDLFHQNPNLIEFIRPYFVGEFKNQLDESKMHHITWIKVTKEANLITKLPITQEQFEELSKGVENEKPKDLPLDMMPILVLKVRK